MKYYETTCPEYIAASKRFDMHPELEPISAKMPRSLSQLGNIILYGPSGAGKYTQFLRLIERYAVEPKRVVLLREAVKEQGRIDSFVGLKTEKMTATTDKQKYEYHISDVHYEIDLSLLGCESKKLWNECFFQIVDIISAKSSKCGIILCKNFQSIHSELLDVFYSYMQHCRALNIHIAFAILTEHVSFIPNRILQCCKLIAVKKPAAELYLGRDVRNSLTESKMTFGESKITFGESKMTFGESKMPESKMTESKITESDYSCVFASQKSHKSFLQQIHPCNSACGRSNVDFCGGGVSGQEDIVPEYLLNIKETNVISKVDSPPKDVFNIVCDNIIAKMVQHNTLDILSLRENLYDILLYGLDITECLWYILYYFVENEILVDDDGEVLSEIMDKMNAFLKYYNNNYRPIYHLESMFIYLITKIYRYPSSPDEQKTSI